MHIWSHLLWIKRQSSFDFNISHLTMSLQDLLHSIWPARPPQQVQSQLLWSRWCDNVLSHPHGASLLHHKGGRQLQGGGRAQMEDWEASDGSGAEEWVLIDKKVVMIVDLHGGCNTIWYSAMNEPILWDTLGKFRVDSCIVIKVTRLYLILMAHTCCITG